ncbi:hypothetical protein [Saccharopolyspora sp. NPDC002686]|uniref:hypothetical protein n=1 Tax=Saccharopolyspora sp. NPDC002686 TaxID=3154541 RepID=UPI00332BFE4C
MAQEIWHKLWKRSWWNGSVTAWCGQTFAPGYYKEALFSFGKPTCTGCRTALKQAGKL